MNKYLEGPLVWAIRQVIDKEQDKKGQDERTNYGLLQGNNLTIKIIQRESRKEEEL